MEEVVDVGTIWNVGHVETVDVMAVVGGETPTNKFQITLDSGAGASCWPAEWMPDVPMKPKHPGVKFRTANGDELEQFGRKDIGFCLMDGNGKGGNCSMEFHVTNATKPLASAMAVVKAGNKWCSPTKWAEATLRTSRPVKRSSSRSLAARSCLRLRLLRGTKLAMNTLRFSAGGDELGILLD